jgi:cell wall-associated NlpC family hydrolase
MTLTRLTRRLQRLQTEIAPDDRVAHFDVTARGRSDGVVLDGVVSHEFLRARAVDLVEAAERWSLAETDVRVLEADRSPRTVDAAVAPVRDGPSGDAEQVTQVLYGAALDAYDERDGWRRVRTPDGYLGWVRAASVTERADCRPEAIVQRAVAASADVPSLFAGVECELTAQSDATAEVRFRTGATAAVPADAVETPPEWPTGEQVVDAARDYLGTEYVWGGMTGDGIDCSGLSWMAYHRNGVTLPRDADQQRAIGRPVGRDETRPADLLFFPGHVAISLGGDEYVHASGSHEEVVVNSFDPNDDRYDPDRDDDFEYARRVL